MILLYYKKLFPLNPIIFVGIHKKKIKVLMNIKRFNMKLKGK